MKPGSNPAKTLDEDLSENIEALKEQVEIAIKSVDENLIDSMLVGQTKIQKNKAVILSWSLDQAEKRDVFHNGDLTEDQEDGIVLYVAIKMKKKSLKESGETSESEADDWNNNEFKSSVYSESEAESQPELSHDPPPVRGTSIRSALRRKRAKNNWLKLVTTMRDVDIADCENMFIKDEYRNIVFDEDDLLAVINGEYVVKTPTTQEEETPNKRVTWRESLEEAFYDTEDEKEEREEKDDCMIVDISSDSGLARLFPTGRAVKSHSAPSSPVKSPQHRPSVRWPRSRSAERSSRTSEVKEVREVTSPSPGHSHVYGDQQNKVRRVRCNHTTNLGEVGLNHYEGSIVCVQCIKYKNLKSDGSGLDLTPKCIVCGVMRLLITFRQAMWLSGGLNSFNRRVRNRTPPVRTSASYCYHYRSKPRASKQTQ